MLKGSEAIYGFVGWLTSRDEEVTFSARHNASKAAELAAEFIKTNKLGDLRQDWVDHLKHPSK